MKTSQQGKYQLGFTIVELLIVIVVIGILAAITIVAFNGIQNRARENSASSAATQAAKKIAIWQVDNPNQIPSDLATMGIVNTASTTYNYRRHTSNTQYCLSATVGDISMRINSSGTQTLIRGSCADISSAAGEPLAHISTPGASVNLSQSLSGTPDITFYAVLQVNSTVDAWFSIASLQPQASNRILQFDTADTGSSYLRYRLDTSDSINANASQNIRTAGKHIGWIQVRNNLTTREFAYDQAGVTHSASMSPGTGWNFSQVRLGSVTSSTQPIAAVVYNTAHNQQTRAEVMQWLADTYSVPMTF